MEGMLWQTTASAELFTEFGPSAYVHDQPKLEPLDVTREQRKCGDACPPCARRPQACTECWIVKASSGK